METVIKVGQLITPRHLLRRALEELEFFSREVKILGVYRAHPFRLETQKAAE
jgi:prephenate dehydratase